MNSKVRCFYHMSDLDGMASAAIVKCFHPEAELYPFDYGMEFPWGKVDNDTLCFLVDISLPKEDMLKLQEVTNLVWIDHHTSTIKSMENSSIAGSRIVGEAACSLTWKYLSFDKVPRGVELLSKYDVFDLSPDVLEYQYGMRALDLDPNNTEDWEYNVFNDLAIPFHIKNGKAILNSRLNTK